MRKPKRTQGEFRFIGWGGKRRGAGRKRRSSRSNDDHLGRETLTREFPAHLTLRLQPGLPSLREKALFEVVLRALSASAFGLFFRIVEYSVQRNHIHLLIEAADTQSLTTGVKSLVGRLSRAINLALNRTGPVLADRYHLHVIKTPWEARHALVYLFGNARKHAREAGVPVPEGWIDPRSSAPWFRGWSDVDETKLRTDPKPVAEARTWLLRAGWRKHGLLSVNEAPAKRRRGRIGATTQEFGGNLVSP